jgi:hypothetical protein
LGLASETTTLTYAAVWALAVTVTLSDARYTGVAATHDPKVVSSLPSPSPSASQELRSAAAPAAVVAAVRLVAAGAASSVAQML